MDNQNLKAFICVASCGSFSDAAHQLYLTQSAVSKRIAQLEQQVGRQLFDRFGRQVSLTEAGSALLPRAQHILSRCDEALQALEDLSGQASGILRLAISHHLGLHRLPPILKAFTRKYPDVRLDIQFMDSEVAYQRVLEGATEIAVITLALETHKSIIGHRVWHDPLKFICAPDHPLAKLNQPLLTDLAAYPVVLPGLNTYTGRIVQNLFSERNIPLSSSMSTNYLETISTLIAIGLGWSVLPVTLVNDLKIMPVDGVIMARELGYIHHRQRSLSNAAQAFLGTLNGVVQGITPG